MKQSETLKYLAPALVKAQAELKAITKDSVNPAFKSRFASLDQIVETVKPLLASHGLTVVQSGTSPITNADGYVVGFVVETMLLHTAGEWITTSAVMPITKGDPQGAGAALTYGRRYGLSAALSLATEEDDDGNHASAAPARAQEPTRGAAKAPEGNTAPPPARRPSAAASDDEPCPKCGGKMWDNRVNKKNPRSPDRKCRDRSCDGVIWPPKDSQPKRTSMDPEYAPPPDDSQAEEELPF